MGLQVTCGAKAQRRGGEETGVRKVDRREMIMQAAERLFTSRRFHEITLDDIVQAAHVGKGTVYTYFKDKEDLFLQAAMSGFDEMCGLLRRSVPGDAPFEQQLRQACDTIAAFFARRRQLFRMIQSEDARMSLCRGSTHEQWVEKRRELVDAVGRIMARGQAEGKARADLSPEALAKFLKGMLRTRARKLDDVNAQVGNNLLVDLFLNGATHPVHGSRRGAGKACVTKEVHK